MVKQSDMITENAIEKFYIIFVVVVRDMHMQSVYATSIGISNALSILMARRQFIRRNKKKKIDTCFACRILHAHAKIASTQFSYSLAFK